MSSIQPLPIHEKTTDEFEKITSSSRELAILWKHTMINYQHLFMAMLQLPCKASSFLVHCNVDKWAPWAKDLYPASGLRTFCDSMPLTKVAERVIKHAHLIAINEVGDTINSVHLLLAMLSFKNDSYAYMYKGVIFMEQGNKQAALENFNIALKYNYTAKYGTEVEDMMKALN